MTEDGFIWTLDGFEPAQAEKSPGVVRDPEGTAWIPSGSLVGVAFGEPTGKAVVPVPGPGVPSVEVIAGAAPSDCCGSRFAVRMLGPLSGSMGYLHLSPPLPPVPPLRRRYPLPDVAPDLVTFREMSAAGVLIHGQTASILWVDQDGRPYGWERVAGLDVPTGRRVALQRQEIGGRQMTSALLQVRDRFVGFSDPAGVEWVTAVVPALGIGDGREL
ncbi:MAG: hypothetical protein ACYDGR_11230 [Candidatus Dormibacteria bacterium]